MTFQGVGLAPDGKKEIGGQRRRRKPDAGPSKTAGAVAAAVTTGTEARLAWIRRRCRYRPLNPGVRMHERACVDGCRPSGSSGNGYQPEAARQIGRAHV